MECENCKNVLSMDCHMVRVGVQEWTCNYEADDSLKDMKISTTTEETKWENQ